MTDTLDVLCAVDNGVGFITLNRPKALNALTLPMVRTVTAALLAWREDRAVKAVVLHGSGDKAFCAGGDIRFFREAALAGAAVLDDFFTEEYALDHLVHVYPRPVIALMDGVVMGGGMGLSQGAGLRIVTERSKLAMPETNIGLFPDVGGGYFLSRLEGQMGEYLALTGHALSGREAVYHGLADLEVTAQHLPELLHALRTERFDSDADVTRTVLALAGDDAGEPQHADSESAFVDALLELDDRITPHFGLGTALDIVQSLEADASPWAQHTAALLRKRSPLMLHVALEQVRRARSLSLEDALRMERDMMRNCFALRPGAASEAVEGIRALAVDKDHAPR
ncbi:MAG: enoyl-CoA hydratase/isomerase family protein, partial [Betaproteobacteria bacterium]|nr:enoyl-CoA hydratase/isomerase family protein [Betaproteobacteria bacterium]